MQGIPNNPKEFLERVNKISPEFEITGKYTKLSETYLHCKCKKCGHERNYSAKTLLEPMISDIANTIIRKVQENMSNALKQAKYLNL